MMSLLSFFQGFNLDLPVTDPVWIFFIVMVIILFAPIVLGKLRIPHIIGMILAGILIGEFGFNILERDSSFELFGKVGLFYIMFLAGLEMDMEDFRKNSVKGLVFGILTFAIPMVLGVWSSMSLLDFGFTSSVLLASMYASHTLVAYPIVSRYGLTRQRSVNITIGGTVITVTLALIILAVIGGMYKGTLDSSFLIGLVVKVIALGLVIVFLFPRIGRWFFRKYDDAVMQFVFVLAMVFLGGGLMAMVGMEGILGAFLVGLVLNPLVPKVSPLMNRLEFVGNALFIPYFLIGVGMIIDVRSLFAGGMALKVAVVMTVVATVSKWLAAFSTQKIFRMSSYEGGMMFGLSNAQAAATLAAVLVGHEIIMPDGERLLNDDVLNGTVVMILFTCVISSLVTEYYSRKLAVHDNEEDLSGGWNKTETERILIPVANPDTIDGLVNLALVLREDMNGDMVAVNIVTDGGSPNSVSEGRKRLEEAAMIASAADVHVNMVSRYDINVTAGIVHTIKEYGITDLVIGLHQKSGILDSFFGSLTNNLLKGTFREVIVSRLLIPVNTVKGILVLVPHRAEYETGFARWVGQICRMASQLDCKVKFRAAEDTVRNLGILCRGKSSGMVSFETLGDMNLVEQLSVRTSYEHLIVVVSSRNGSISYDSSFDRLPSLLNKYCSNNSFMILYPEQIDRQEIVSFSDPLGKS